MIEGTDPPTYADGTPRDGYFECVLRIEKPMFDEALDAYYQWYEQEDKNAVP
jgi:hypothetical protein